MENTTTLVIVTSYSEEIQEDAAYSQHHPCFLLPEVWILPCLDWTMHCRGITSTITWYKTWVDRISDRSNINGSIVLYLCFAKTKVNVLQGVFFNWCSPKSSKCFSVSKIFWAFKLVPQKCSWCIARTYVENMKRDFQNTSAVERHSSELYCESQLDRS